MELLITILFYVAIWLGAGILSTVLKMFVFFRGPVHMLTLYLQHPSTQKSALLLIELAKKNEPDHIIGHIVLVSIIAGAIFAPLSIIDLILDLFRFTNFKPKQESDNEQK